MAGCAIERRLRTSSVIFPPAAGSGFASVSFVVEHKGVADAGLRFRAQLVCDQPITLADNGVHKSAIWRMADKYYRSARRVVKPRTQSQQVQRS